MSSNPLLCALPLVAFLLVPVLAQGQAVREPGTKNTTVRAAHLVKEHAQGTPGQRPAGKPHDVGPMFARGNRRRPT